TPCAHTWPVVPSGSVGIGTRVPHRNRNSVMPRFTTMSSMIHADQKALTGLPSALRVVTVARHVAAAARHVGATARRVLHRQPGHRVERFSVALAPRPDPDAHECREQ